MERLIARYFHKRHTENITNTRLSCLRRIFGDFRIYKHCVRPAKTMNTFLTVFTFSIVYSYLTAKTLSVGAGMKRNFHEIPAGPAIISNHRRFLLNIQRAVNKKRGEGNVAGHGPRRQSFLKVDAGRVSLTRWKN